MERRRHGDGITAGLLLIGLGILLFTGWWWPGIMVVLGIAIASGLAFRGRYAQAAIMALIFFSIPLLVSANIAWQIFGPMVLVGVGIVVLAKAFYLKDTDQ